MYIKFSEKLKLNISEEFLKQFNRMEQFPGQVEAGGILLGKYDLRSHTYYISGITTPNRNDSAGFSFFIRNKNAAQKEINKAWKKSKGVVNYLGEWHTHCCQHPLPSSTDLSFIKQIVEDRVSPYEHFFMIIVGQKKNICVIVSKSNDTKEIQQISKNYGGELL